MVKGAVIFGSTRFSFFFFPPPPPPPHQAHTAFDAISGCVAFVLDTSQRLLPPADWQAQQPPVIPLQAEVSTKRKRCRQDDGSYDSTVPSSSAQDLPATNVGMFVRAPTELDQSQTARVVKHSGETQSTSMASQSRSEALGATGLGVSALSGCGLKSGAVLAVAKQAAAVLQQHACRQEQQRADTGAQQPEQTHRCLSSVHCIVYTYIPLCYVRGHPHATSVLCCLLALPAPLTAAQERLEKAAIPRLHPWHRLTVFCG